MEDINIKIGNVKGVSRKMDDFGRIIIPSQFRKELGMEEKEKTWIEMFLIDDGIYIRKKKFLYKGE